MYCTSNVARPTNWRLQEHCKSLKNLGYVINGEGIRTDPDKISAMVKYARPQTCTEVKIFVDLCYAMNRRFINNFFEGLMSPIYASLKGKKNR